jgi:hypothetical protein
LHHLIFNVGFYFLPVINSEDAWDKAKKQNNLTNMIWENWDKSKQLNIFKDVLWSDSLRLSKYFGNSAKFWLGLQDDFDIEEELLAKSSMIQAISPLKVT